MIHLYPPSLDLLKKDFIHDLFEDLISFMFGDNSLQLQYTMNLNCCYCRKRFLVKTHLIRFTRFLAKNENEMNWCTEEFVLLECCVTPCRDSHSYSDPHFWFPLTLDWAVTNSKNSWRIENISREETKSATSLSRGRNIDVTLPITLCWTDISVIVWAQTFVAFLSIIQIQIGSPAPARSAHPELWLISERGKFIMFDICMWRDMEPHSLRQL